jgi:hypothetical protein
MRMPSTTVLLLNGAAVLIAVASVVTMGRSMILGDGAESCQARYDNAIQWSLRRDDGTLLSTTDLQARLGGTDWGLMERVTVVKADRAGAALAVELSGVGTRTAAGVSHAPSAGFEWMPQSAGPVAAACASYALKLDSKFDFAAGGRLPGLLGGPSGSDRKSPQAFSMRLAWDASGGIDIVGQIPAGGSPFITNERDKFELPRGRWITVDQEVILNTPGQSNGIVRVWLDGKLRFESRGLALRSNDQAAVRGVLAEVAYARPSVARDVASTVQVTPFEFRW